jgi:tRNA pseudouridine38-40 synthase
MPRYKITIEYDGTGLAGWQRQEEVYSVQESVERAIEGFSQEAARVQCAGRTDAGVHARGQVAHFDLEKDWDEYRVKQAINSHLRNDMRLPTRQQVVVLGCEKVADDFNARFSPKQRHYVYRIICRKEFLALEKNRAWQVPEKLDAAAMHKAAQIFVGEHDFTSFRAAACQAKSAVKTIDKISVVEVGEVIEIRVSALSFLHHQIRNFAGALRQIGNGKTTAAELKIMLIACDRTVAAPTAPAHGLYFLRVDY